MGALRVLIIRLGGLGDSILLWPAVAAVRQRHARARLTLLGHRGRLGLLVGERGADEALEVEGSGLHLLFGELGEPSEALRRRFGAFDVVVAFASAGDCALAENLSACGAGEVHAFLPPQVGRESRHAARQALDALVEAGLAEATAWASIPPLPGPSSADQARAEALLQAAGVRPDRLALLAPGAGGASKRWPAWRFAELAARLAEDGWQPAWCLGPAEAEALEAVRGAGGRSWPVFEDHSPAALRALITRAALWVGNDSGPTHLAGLLGRACLGLFGPTDPEVWRPLGPRARFLRAELACAPCTDERQRACEQQRCLEGLAVDEVLAALRQMARPG
jgi:ADP-heptose:LPS heptosyltransferase